MFTLSNFTSVTAPVAIFSVVTFPSLIFAVSTASLAKSPTTIVPSRMFPVSTLLAPIAVNPALFIVTSPLIVTSVATFEVFPR